MNNKTSYIKRLIRFGLLGLVLLLGSCADSGSLQLADGIGGTGITMGRLTSFGSVYVNGVRFNTDNAQFIRDGGTASVQSDFSVGEIVQVTGTINADRKTGTATKVVYSDVLEGSVTRVAEGRTLRVMEQQVITDQLTVFHGFKKLADLRLENVVEVSGFTNAEGQIQATSIKLVSETYVVGGILEVEGTVSQLNIAAQTFRINDLTVHYSQAMLINLAPAELRDGLYLVVATQQAIDNGVIIASEITKLDDTPEVGVAYEIEGVVSYFLSTGYFEVDGLPVAANADTVYENGSLDDLGENSAVLIEGVANNQGTIIAKLITLLDHDSEVYLEAKIEAVDLDNNSLTVLGQTVSVTPHTLLSDDTTEDFVMLKLSQFVVGESVYIAAYQDADGQYIASRLSKVLAIETLYLSGSPRNLDAAQGNLSLFGNSVISDGVTLYLDANLNEMTRSDFFGELSSGGLDVEVTGTKISNGFLLAETMILFIE